MISHSRVELSWPFDFCDLELALFHRTDLGAEFMVMTAYFDESGTHGAESPATIFGGMASTAGRWRDFNDAFGDLLRKHGIEKFHAKDFKNRNGPFKRMSFEEYAKFNSSFLHLIDHCVVRGIVIVLPSKPYKEMYRPRFKGMRSRPDSEYGLCFRAAILMYVKELDQGAFPLVPVLEAGHKNAGDAVRVYNELKALDDIGALGPMSFETKASCLPLAAADSIAYGMFRTVTGRETHENPNIVPSGPALPSYYAGATPGEAKITRVIIDESTLDYLSSGLR